ncbi:DUF1858 domain-containing protein [Promineifilum sp.]|uniref:DUF1858 domain-containing protein n=1 Tax=Promineifilum sp. TaxID=2664178 RepID=UPI0035B22CCA
MPPDEEPTSMKLLDMILTDLLERWPETAAVFHEHAMACVGCAVASFYTVRDAALVYGLPPEQFAAELAAVVGAV